MNKMLVAVFENETTAYEGLSALKDLHQDGDITLYASAVISKNREGKLLLKTAAEPSPRGSCNGDAGRKPDRFNWRTSGRSHRCGLRIFWWTSV